MRVLVVTHNFPRFEGDPAGAFVARLADGMASRGHEMSVLAPHAPGLPLRERRNGLDVIRFRYAPDPFERVAYRGDLHGVRASAPLEALGVVAFLAGLRRAVHRAVAELAPGVIHAHWWVPGGWAAVGTGVPTVVTCHGSDVRLLARSRLLRRLAGRVLPRAAGVTTVSTFLARELEAAIPALHDRVHTITMPLDVESFARAKGTARVQPPRILYAGNLVESKGVGDLLAAVALLRDQGVVCRLRVLGEGPHRAALRAAATALGLDGIVEWSDFVPQQAMPAEYAASTVVVLPTRGNEEGLGLTLVEALLAGTAVVGTSAGGIPDVVRSGETGLLARPGDPADLADKLHLMLTSPATRSRLAEQGGRHVLEAFKPARSVDQFLELLHAAVGHRVAA